MTPKDFVGIVVAAGAGARCGGTRPKQFADLGGVSVLERSVRALASRPELRGVVVVLAEAELDGPAARAARAWPGVLAVVAGGATRLDSVRRGLAGADAPFVLVHDAARPLVAPRLVAEVIEATRRHGAAVPGLPVTDTVKQLGVGDWVDRTIDRANLRLAQTPQGARTAWLRAALESAAGAGGATDEAAALEHAGHPVAVVPGDPGNSKITTREDLEAARSRVDGPPGDLRVGTGFDVHARDPGRSLVLGGVGFPGEPGLAGHSDADVVLHAAMDAMLGAAALGDIGVLFPPTDPRFAGADSRMLAAEVARQVGERGYRLVNLDLTLLAESPRIGERRDEMRVAIAFAFGTSPERVGLKATTLERLGALGRGEGIACQAAVLLARRSDT